MLEVLRWGADIVALQECESATGFPELLESHQLVGAVQAAESR